MKPLLFLLFTTISGQTMATDLIFKSGFENSALVSGTATGINNTGLSLQLTSQTQTELLFIVSNGGFSFKTEVTVGDAWTVDIISLPSTPQQQNCVTSNSDGNMPATGVDNLQVTCNDTHWNWNQMNWEEGGWN